MSGKLQRTHLIMQSYHNPMVRVIEPSICQRQIEGHMKQTAQQSSILLQKKSFLLMMTFQINILTMLNSILPYSIKVFFAMRLVFSEWSCI